MKKTVFAAFTLGLAVIGGVASADPPMTNTRGTIEQLTDHSLVIETHGGKKIPVDLTDKTAVIGVRHAEIADIKPGSYVGSAAVPQPDGTLKALEVQVFDPSLRGANEGHFAWDLGAGSTMTNGTVGALVVSRGRTMTVKYNGAEKKIVVPEDVPVVSLAPADRRLLLAGVHVVVVAPKSTGSRLNAAMVLAGQDGVVPPM